MNKQRPTTFTECVEYLMELPSEAQVSWLVFYFRDGLCGPFSRDVRQDPPYNFLRDVLLALRDSPKVDIEYKRFYQSIIAALNQLLRDPIREGTVLLDILEVVERLPAVNDCFEVLAEAVLRDWVTGTRPDGNDPLARALALLRDARLSGRDRRERVELLTEIAVHQFQSNTYAALAFGIARTANRDLAFMMLPRLSALLLPARAPTFIEWVLPLFRSITEPRVQRAAETIVSAFLLETDRARTWGDIDRDAWVNFCDVCDTRGILSFKFIERAGAEYGDPHPEGLKCEWHPPTSGVNWVGFVELEPNEPMIAARSMATDDVLLALEIA